MGNKTNIYIGIDEPFRAGYFIHKYVYRTHKVNTLPHTLPPQLASFAGSITTLRFSEAYDGSPHAGPKVPAIGLCHATLECLLDMLNV